MIQIETNVPVPDRRAGGGKPPVYPFGELEIGHSFALPDAEATKLGGAAKKWKERHPGWNYRTKKSMGQIRLWRIA